MAVIVLDCLASEALVGLNSSFRSSVSYETELRLLVVSSYSSSLLDSFRNTDETVLLGVTGASSLSLLRPAPSNELSSKRFSGVRMNLEINSNLAKAKLMVTIIADRIPKCQELFLSR